MPRGTRSGIYKIGKSGYYRVQKIRVPKTAGVKGRRKVKRRRRVVRRAPVRRRSPVGG